MVMKLVAASLGAGLVLFGAGLANAQTYPHKEPIKIVVPFPPGGPTDGMARIISENLQSELGQTIVIENRGGAGGAVGAKSVADSTPDGYTLLMTPGGALTTGPAVNPEIGYDPAKVFTPVCQLIETPLIISVAPTLSANSLSDVVAYAKANPGKLVWGNQGFGTAPHLLAEMFKLETGISMLNVPYRGDGPLLNAVLGKQVQIMADPTTSSLPFIQAGNLRPIAIAGSARDPELPTVPTVVEEGFPKLQAPFWLAVMAPAGTPRDVIETLNHAFRDALAAPETVKKLKALDTTPKTGTPEELGAMLAKELAQWKAVVTAAHLQMQ
jgi:tripartite-type tricarboxylate transporter receptor subunit TctC